jgi:hypothetical protein
MTRPSSRGRGVAAIRGTSATPPVIRPPLIFRTHPPVWPMSPGCPLRGHRGMTGVWVFADTWAEHSEEGPCRLRCHATDTAPANQTTFFPDAGPALSRAEIRDPRLILQAMSPPSVPDGAARLREKCVGGRRPVFLPPLAAEEGPCRLRRHATDTAPANQNTFFPDAGPALSRAEIREPRLILQAMSPPVGPGWRCAPPGKMRGGWRPVFLPPLGGKTPAEPSLQTPSPALSGP